MTVEQFRAYMRGALAFSTLVAYVLLAILGAPDAALATLGTLTGVAFTFYYKRDEQ